MDNIKKNVKAILAVVISSWIIVQRCAFGVITVKTMALTLLPMLVGMVYVITDIVIEKEQIRIKKYLLPFIWMLGFFGLEVIYAMVGLGNTFSRSYTILSMGPAAVVFLILIINEERLKLLSYISEIVILLISLITFIFDNSIYMYWIPLHLFTRFGKCPFGTVIDTANLYVLMLIPILCRMILEKQFKRYFLLTVYTVLLILATGSKAPVFATAIIFMLLVIAKAETSTARIRSIVIIVFVGILVAFLCFKTPILYGTIGSRIVELFTTIGAKEYDLTTSSGQRMAALEAALEHWKEKPIFGHGFYAFSDMEYSPIIEYYEDGIAKYRGIQTHINYLELLFSFGIVGTVMYYWFPIKLVIASFLKKDKIIKLASISYMVTFLIIDAGLDMFYKYMTPYMTYLIVYALLEENNEEQRHS